MCGSHGINVSVSFSNVLDEHGTQERHGKVAEHGKAEDRPSELSLLREADRMNWHFLLLQEDERVQHAGSTMAWLVTQLTHSYFEYARPATEIGLRS